LLLLLFLEVIKYVNAKNAFDKVVTVSLSNNARVWGLSPQLPEANGGSEADPPTPGYFNSFFQKYAFLSIFWSKFLLKNAFLNG